jgi:hypothetical protein
LLAHAVSYLPGPYHRKYVWGFLVQWCRALSPPIVETD